MKIEIGKVYEVSAYWKKSLTEIEMFKHEDGKALNTEVLWRNGTFLIRPENQEEVDYLTDCQGEDGDIWDYEDYESIEMLETFDGCAEDFVFYGSGENSWSEEEENKLEEEYETQLEDDDEWQSRYEFLEERGYISQGCNWQIHGGITIEESEHEMSI